MISRYIEVFIFFTVFIITGCTYNKDKFHLVYMGEKSFNVGYRVSHKYCGEFHYSGKDYFYFGDIATKKKITIFTPEGTKVYEVPLNNVLNEDEIEGIAIKTLDTIVVLSLNTNHLYFINRSGQIWHSVDLNPYIIDKKNGFKYQLLSSTYYDFYFKDAVFLRCYLIWNESQRMKKTKQYASYFQKINKGPFLIRISSLFGDSVKLSFGVNGFFDRFCGTNEIIDDFPFYYHSSDKLFCFSSFNDSIYEIDPEVLRITKVHYINSDHTLIKKTPIQINEENVNNYPRVLKQVYYKQGSINRFFYDCENKLYYVFAFHSIPFTTDEDQSSTNGKCSLLVYDIDFKKLFERVFDAAEYTPGFTIVYNKSIYIFHYKPNKNDNKREIVNFSVFKVDTL